MPVRKSIISLFCAFALSACVQEQKKGGAPTDYSASGAEQELLPDDDLGQAERWRENLGPVQVGQFFTHKDFALRGPENARGVIVYSHGRWYRQNDAGCGRDLRNGPTSPIVKAMYENGNDVFFFDRPPCDDMLEHSVVTMAASLRELAKLGYEKITLMGKSRGAWQSLAVLSVPGISSLVDDIVGFAPANQDVYTRRTREGALVATLDPKALPKFISMLHGIPPAESKPQSGTHETRILLIHCAYDKFWPEGPDGSDTLEKVMRAEQAILSSKGFPTTVLGERDPLTIFDNAGEVRNDKTQGLPDGHGCINRESMVRTYRPLVESFLDSTALTPFAATPARSNSPRPSNVVTSSLSRLAR